jgi:hypothetical protein
VIAQIDSTASFETENFLRQECKLGELEILRVRLGSREFITSLYATLADMSGTISDIRFVLYESFTRFLSHEAKEDPLGACFISPI